MNNDPYKRCEWCFDEYNVNDFDIDNPRPFLKSVNDIDISMNLCSVECMEEVVLDRLEDKKLERKMGK